MYTEITEVSRVKEIIKIITPLSHLSEEVIIQKLVDSRALLEGHWILLSGKHSSVFLKFRLIAEKCNNGFLKQIAKELSSKFEKFDVNVVLGPETAATLLVDKISEELGARPALAKAGENGRPSYSLRLNSEIKKRDNVLIVNDLTTTGKGLKRLVTLVQEKKAKVAGIGLFATRNKAVIEELCSKIPNVHVLATLNVKDVDPPCDLCRKKVTPQYSVDHN